MCAGCRHLASVRPVPRLDSQAQRRGGGSNPQIDSRRDRKSSRDAQHRNQIQPGGQGAGDRPCGVRSVEKAEPESERVNPEEGRPDDERQRGPHQRRRHEQDRKRHQKPCEGEGRHAAGERG